jgi:DNA-directed RNA polymerase subunit RPC12/RpoP
MGELYSHHTVDGVYDSEREVFNTKSTDYTWHEKDVLEFTLCKVLTTEEYFEYRGNKELLSEKADIKKENDELKNKISLLEKALEYWKEKSTYWHDLRKDPTDLPEGYDKERAPKSYLVKIAYTSSLDESGFRNPDGSPATVYYYKVIWCRAKYYFDINKGEKVVAWRELPLYEEEIDVDELPTPEKPAGMYHCPKCGTDFDTSLILCSDPPKVRCPNCNTNFPIGKLGE